MKACLVFHTSIVGCVARTPFLSTGNANATPSTVHPSNTRKHVAPYRASPRDGLRPTSSDLEPKKESKPHEGRKEIGQALIGYPC